MAGLQLQKWKETAPNGRHKRPALVSRTECSCPRTRTPQRKPPVRQGEEGEPLGRLAQMRSCGRSPHGRTSGLVKRGTHPSSRCPPRGPREKVVSASQEEEVTGASCAGSSLSERWPPGLQELSVCGSRSLHRLTRLVRRSPEGSSPVPTGIRMRVSSSRSSGL